MCGIAGIWNFNGLQVAEESIIRFTDSLKHRGPDGRGIWLNENKNLALGHRRLAIIDLSREGDQPMHYADNRYHIVYNGEIFNFIEIKEELVAKGYHFKTNGDTEVIMAAYHEWKEHMLHKFNGMWALCLFDSQNNTCFIARDRFGIKPFHFLLSSQQFAFASELKAFKHLDGYIPAVDETSAIQFLKTGFGVESSAKTMFRNVHKLQAGNCAWITNGTIKIKRWWNTAEHLQAVPSDLASQANRFRELFFDAVKLRMRSDVSVGSSLSGGFDSSAVVSAIAQMGAQQGAERMAANWQQTFVATFPGKSNDERPQAEEVVAYNQVKGHFFEVNEEESLEMMDRVLYDFDDVYVGIPIAPWLIYRELRRNNIVVSLDGHGADELMGGYLHADGAFLSNAPSWIGGAHENLNLLNAYQQYIGKSPYTGFAEAFKNTLPAQLNYHPDFAPYRQLIKTLKSWKDQWSASFWQSFIHKDVYQVNDGFPITEEAPQDMDETNRKLYQLFHADVLPTILRNFDRMSMANGIEVRMPFMDWRLVAYTFSLPGSSKIQNGYTKLIAREAMKGYMPESIRASRVKVGFNAPMPEWFNGPVFPWLMEQLNKPSPFINHQALKQEAEKRYKNKAWDWNSTGNFWKYVHYLWFENNFIKSGQG
jgi:asparagine synthase (glutamine-hydrolysing)